MNPFTIAKDIKNIEKILKPALEKYIQGAGFAKSDETVSYTHLTLPTNA